MSSTRFYSALLVLAGTLLLAGTATPAQAQFGVAAGLNFESAGDIEASEATVDNSTGYHIGAVYDLGLGPVNLRPGLFYRDLGQTFEFPGASADVSAWEVPLDVRVTVLPTPLVSPYLVGGPQARFLQSDLDEFEDNVLEDISYSFSIGVGATVSLGTLVTLQPELRYDVGLSNYIDEEFEIGGASFTADDSSLSAFALRVHVLF